MVAEAVAFTLDFSLIILTAISLSYVARQTGQPTLIAYIFTGIVLGPVLIDVVTQTELVDLMRNSGSGFSSFSSE